MIENTKIPNLIDESPATLDNLAEMEDTAKTTLSTLLIQLTNIAYAREPEEGQRAAIAYARGLTEGIQLFLMAPSDVIFIPEDDLLKMRNL